MIKTKNNIFYRIHTHTVLGSLILLLCCPALYGAGQHTISETDTVCKTLRSMGRLLLTLEESRKAKDIFEKALDIARQNQSSPAELSQCLMDTAWVYKDLSLLTESESLYQEAAGLRESQVGKEHPDMIDVWRNLADIHRQMGKYALAENELNNAIRIFSLYHQDDEDSYGPLWTDMGQLLTEMGKPEQADPYYHKAEKMVTGTYGPEHLYTAGLYSKMAYLYCIRKQSNLSETYLKRAEAIYDKYAIKNPSLVVPDLLIRARLYVLESNYSQALRAANSALAIAEKNAGKRTPLAADCISTIADINFSKGNFKEAEKYARKARERFEMSLGKTNTKTLQASYLVLKSLFHQNRFKDIEPLRREIISQIKKNSSSHEILINRMYDDLLNFNS